MAFRLISCTHRCDESETLATQCEAKARKETTRPGRPQMHGPRERRSASLQAWLVSDAMGIQNHQSRTIAEGGAIIAATGSSKA
jgi:hypothetical protein